MAAWRAAAPRRRGTVGRADDLGALLAAALAAERRGALERGEVERAELLQHLAVLPGRDEFTLSLDLPVDALERQFQGCREKADGGRR